MAGAAVREIEGILEEVDLKTRSCRIRPARGRAVRASFGPRRRDAVAAALGRRVRAAVASSRRDGGKALPTVRRVYVVEPHGGKRMTAADLLDSGLVGIWARRKDIGDSLEFARKLRERTWKRA